MSTFKKKALEILSVVFVLSMALGLAFWGGKMQAAADVDYITTTFSADMGLWASDPGSTATTEMAYDETEGGYLKMNLTGGSPTIVLNNIGLDTAQYSAMAMRIKYELQDPASMAHSSLGNHFSIYYSTEKIGFGSALYWPNITEQVKDSDWKTIIVDFTDSSNAHPDLKGSTKWEGTVNRFRLDPIWSEGQHYTIGDKISIDFVKFFENKESAEAAVASGWEDDATVDAKGSENYFNFTKGAEGWEQSQNNADGSGWDNGGELKVVLGNDDPQITRSWKIGVSLDEYKFVAFKMKNMTVGEKAKIYYGTKTSPNYGEDKAATVTLGANSDYAVYTFDMTRQANWKGVLQNLRFDVVDDSVKKPASGFVMLDWLGFYRTKEEIPEVSVEDDDTTLPEGPVEEFSFTDGFDGWKANDDAVLSNNYNALVMTMAAGKDDPNITYSFENGLKTTTYPVLQVKMRNRTAGTKFTIYFAGKGAAIDGSKSEEFTIGAQDTAYRIYTWNLAALSVWSDEDVYTLRLDPTDKGDGEVLIDYIRFYRSEGEAELNGQYEDDSVERENAHTEFNFNLFNSYWKNASSDNADVACKDGNMVISLKGAAPVVEYEWEHGDYSDWAEGIDAKTWNYLVFKIKVTSERETAAGKLQFKRNLVGSKYSEDLQYPFEVAAGEWTLVKIDLKSNHFWNSTVAGLRLYPVLEGEKGETAEIDYLKFYKSEDDILVDGDYQDDPTGEAKTYFDFRESENRFDEARASHGTVNITENGMVTTIAGQDPVLMYPYVYDGVGLNADVYKFMKISMKNETTSTMFEFFWDCMDANGNVTNWGSTSNFTIETMSANDAQFKEYIIDFSAKPDWKGTILRMRYDPAGWINETEVSGTVTTQYIKFYKTAEEAASDHPWDNDPVDPPDPVDPEKPGDQTFTEWKKNPLSIAGMVIGCLGFALAALGVVLVLKK